jgi:hypothetical protein
MLRLILFEWNIEFTHGDEGEEFDVHVMTNSLVMV